MIGLAVAFVAVGSYLFFFLPRNQVETTPLPQSSSDTNPALPPIGDLVIGSVSAPAVIIEYVDYKCPKCGEFHRDTWPELKKNYIDTGKLKVVLRPYPVYGEDGAKAVYGSYCAAAQQKLEPYHDSVFSYMWETYFSKKDYDATVRNTLDASAMKTLTEEVGMDSQQYVSCVDNIIYKSDYDKAMQAAAQDGIQGTPSFMIHGQKVVGAQPYTVFKTLVELQL